jgi:hypothetical protein
MRRWHRRLAKSAPTCWTEESPLPRAIRQYSVPVAEPVSWRLMELRVAVCKTDTSLLPQFFQKEQIISFGMTDKQNESFLGYLEYPAEHAAQMAFSCDLGLIPRGNIDRWMPAV